jgi:hypothetical protein
LDKNGLSVNEDVRIEPQTQDIRYEELDENVFDETYTQEESKMKEV